MPIVLDRALLLRRTPFAESSLVAQVFTRRHGRVHIMAKGAFRRTSRYYCVLDLFDTLDVDASAKPQNELALLRSASVAVRRRAPRTHLASYRAALQMLELCDLAVRPGQPDAELFDLLERCLDALEAPADGPQDSSGSRARQTLIEFELGFLQNLGLAPSLLGCASCGKSAPPVASGSRPEGEPADRVRENSAEEPSAQEALPRVAFSAGAGGRLCLECARSARAAGKRVGTLPEKLLADVDLLAKRELLQNSASNLRSGVVTWSAPRLAELGSFVERFMDYHLETTPRSRRELRESRTAPKASRGGPR